MKLYRDALQIPLTHVDLSKNMASSGGSVLPYIAIVQTLKIF